MGANEDDLLAGAERRLELRPDAPEAAASRRKQLAPQRRSQTLIVEAAQRKGNAKTRMLAAEEKSANRFLMLNGVATRWWRSMWLVATLTSLVCCVAGQLPPMCQYQQRAAAAAAASSLSAYEESPVAGQPNLVVVCPKSSQYNNLAQHFAGHKHSKQFEANLQRNQREILKNLNASFTNHLQLNERQAEDDQVSSPASATPQQPPVLPSDLIDDELLNEIVSPIVVDAAYERAKELIVKRRKLENELVRQGNLRASLSLSLAEEAARALRVQL